MKRELSFLLAAAMAASLAGCAADIADADSSITALNDSATAELTSYNAADAVTLTFTDSGIAGGDSGVEIDGTALIVSESGTTDSETAQEASLTIRELTLTINAPVNDAVNAEQLLNVESGTITIDAGDDALHCDLVMNVGADGTDGPTITITNAYEGLEAATLNIASSNIDIPMPLLPPAASSGMGMAITAEQAYVTFGSGRGGMGGGQRPDMSEQPADGERPELPDNADTQPDDAPSPPQGEIENAPQGVPDMEGEAATQQPPMMQADDSTDSGSISLTAGDSFTITDADGNTIYSGIAVCNASYVFYSSTGLTADTTYTFAADTASVEATARIDTSSTGMEGGMGGQRPDGGRQQNADVLPADDTQKRSA